MSNQIIGAEIFSGLEHHACRHEFAPLRVGYSEDRCFENRRMLVDDGFDLAGIDIFSTGDDHVLHAVEDVEISVRILVADVSSSKQSVLKRKPGLLRIVPVAAHDVGAASHQFAGLPGLELLSRSSTTRKSTPGHGRPQDMSLSSVCSWSWRPVRNPASLSP